MNTNMLLTGFEPFGGMEMNPSQLVVDRLEQDGISWDFPITLNCAILPVRFRDSALKMRDLMEAQQPEVVLSLGVDLGKKNIELESTAHQISTYIDADYLQESKKNLPQQYQTQLNLASLRKKLVEQGHKFIVSDDSGAFVCNHVYYLAQQFNIELRLNAKVLFVHVPYTFPYYKNHKKINPDFSADEIYQAIRALVIELSADNLLNSTI